MTTEHAPAGAGVTANGNGNGNAVPEVSSRYELREQLQTSVTGATWRAWDRSTERPVDIRQLRPPAQLAFEQRRAMVARWARAALRAQRAQFPGLALARSVGTVLAVRRTSARVSASMASVPPARFRRSGPAR